ncbi:Interferon-induced 44 family [Chlorella sorokiniana]|uniref:Interferon-induced 44 family n=1 Tax=Chlorella sorokiniana TaxID=3076 RepID=A0A2P6TBW3_CHLSO|nr:Interferon-induced 44 family [Chlorella sorokiniana]|eukprot:PRW18377.1 Interferon-induced 44 family [Chlorella sorokiniana]
MLMQCASGTAAAPPARQCFTAAAGGRPPRRRRQRPCTPPRAQQEPELDLVERFVGKLFGRAALEDPTPGGLKRLSDEAAKELYPATTDEWAEPLAGDGPDVAALRPLLAQTQLERAPLRLAFDADRGGWSATAFHQAVDGYGAALVVAETEGGALIGGYNPRGWVSLGEDRDAIAAFLFTWRDGDFSRRPIKLPKVGGAALAVVKDQPSSGIHFGPDGLSIPLAPGNERLAKCKLGPYYARLPDGGKSLFAPTESGRGTPLAGLRVYLAEGGPEQWELDGIVWKTKRS